MTNLRELPSLSDLDWWVERFGVRFSESGPPLFQRRSNVYRRKSATISRPFAESLIAALPDDAASEPRRIHELVLAAVAGVLYRYSASDEPKGIVVGSPPTPDHDEVLPILVAVDGQATFGGVLDAVAASLSEAADHAEVTAEALIERLAMDEVKNRHPLFPVVVRVEGRQSAAEDLRNDTTVVIHPDGGSVTLELEYNANVQDQATVERFGDHVLGFLEAALTDPRATVASIRYLRPEERSQLIDEWSGGAVGEPDPRCLHELFEDAAARTPDADAIVFGEEESISYAGLDERANQLANHLRSLGAGRGSRVGLCVPASADLLLGVLGILKSGAAAVPIVPTFPAARNAMAIADSGMEVAVTVTSLLDRFPDSGPTLVCLDRDAEAIAAAPASRPDAGTTPDDLLYVLFTSGSTGRPKGVAMEHKTIVNLVLWQRERGGDPAGKRTLARTSIGFDVSFQEIFSTWGFGGALVVTPDDVRDDVSQLPDFLARYGVARVFLPPVSLDQVATTAALRRVSLRSLEEIIVAGEQLQISIPTRRLFHELGCSLDNQYGPTETHVATAYMLEGASMRWPDAPPIGRPVRNMRVYVLDSQRQPVPVGVPGELFIGGIGPARGYLDAQQTAEKFLDDPFAGKPGARMYRTGDAARFLADGNIEFIGRLDAQVKIRGYRMELGEIEAKMLEMPGIRQVAVAVHDSDVVGKQLAGYVVREEPGTPDAAAIREFLMHRLPGHMIPAPSSIVFMDSLPITPTGKVDRRALPEPPRATSSGPTAAAQGDTEQLVADVWSRALGVESVGRDDNFIDLGGHSLVGIQIVSQINEAFKIALPLRTLLRGITVTALADEIDRLRGVTPEDRSATNGAAEGAELVELKLPDGRSIACLQRAETEYLFLDVFGHKTYDGGGISYPEHGVVLDVGAHVGLFTLYAKQKSPGLEVHAFEPCPPLFEALRRNTESLDGVTLHSYALSSERGDAELTFYPNLTGMTSFHPDESEERTLLTGILRNLGDREETAGSALLADSREYLDERLLSSTFTANRRTLSDVLAELGLERVDLLKIDVQKAELEVLQGIAADDWPKIRQLAIEVHDLGGALATIESMLADAGYSVTTDQDPLHAGTPVHFVYAVREA
jgi:amino acid adenylation domain-containing protein/FkbM family methyltransferase